jgi:exopolysaccharide biosynthesis protein
LAGPATSPHRLTLPMRPLVTIALTVLACATGNRTAAAERTTTPYPGVSHIHRTDNSQDYHLVVLKPKAMDVVATDQDQAWSVVSEFAKKVGAQIAINANFFSKTESCGVTAGDGHLWTSVYEGCPMTMAFFRDGRATIVAGKVRKDGVLSPSIGLVAAVSGRPRLVENSQPSPAVEAFAKVRHPRTALGLKKDGTLLILVADGRRDAALGFTGPEMSEIFLREGAVDAINLDGGGSTTLYIEAEGGVQNKPSDGHERVVVNQLGFKRKGSKGATP